MPNTGLACPRQSGSVFTESAYLSHIHSPFGVRAGNLDERAKKRCTLPGAIRLALAGTLSFCNHWQCLRFSVFRPHVVWCAFFPLELPVDAKLAHSCLAAVRHSGRLASSHDPLFRCG